MKKIFTLLTLVLTGVLSVFASGPSGTLPVIYINIDNGAEVTSKETYLKAKYWLDPKGSSDVVAIGSESAPLTMKIKGRGNYTFTGFEKKPYRLKLDNKQPLMGLESSKHFGLLAHADDTRGFLRNTIGFEIAKGVGLPWTPEQRPVELVINGTYRGLYFLVELIRIDKKRVNIKAWGEEDAAGNPLDKWIEGGTLIEIDNYDEEGQIQLTDGDGEIMRITYDKSVDPGYEPDGYCSWLSDQFETMNDLIFGDKNSDEIWNYIDIDDCARFMLVQDIVNNYESFHGSCYMHREKGDGEKWHFSPVWDFGSALFVDSHPGYHFWENSYHHNHWAGELWQFQKLQDKMKEIWISYQENDFNSLVPFAQNFLTQITQAAACDKERWPQYGNTNLSSNKQYLETFLSGAKTFLNTTFNYTAPLRPTDFVVPEDEDCVYHVFFLQTGKALEWPLVKIFYWDEGMNNINFDWPGVYCDYVKVGGKNYWHYKLTTQWESDDFRLIFNDGNSGVKDHQTEDLMVRKRGVYNLDMNRHAVPNEFLAVGAGPSSIDSIESDPANDLTISKSNGQLVIESGIDSLINVASIDGTVRTLRIVKGVNTFTLPQGLYIIGGKKFAF